MKPSDPPLTPRETEVLILVANGKSSKEIAAALGIAFKTATCNREHIYRKLGIRNIANLTRYAIRHGLVKLDGPVQTREPGVAEQSDIYPTSEPLKTFTAGVD